MALEIKRKFKETSQSLTHRFSKRVKGSGILLQARKIRFRKRPKSHYAKKSAALRKVELKKEHEKLRKLGKLNKR